MGKKNFITVARADVSSSRSDSRGAARLGSDWLAGWLSSGLKQFFWNYRRRIGTLLDTFDRSLDELSNGRSPLAVARPSGPSRSPHSRPSRSPPAVVGPSGPSRSPLVMARPNMCKVTVEIRGGIRFQLEVDLADKVEKLKERIDQFYRENNLNHYFLSHQSDGQSVYMSFENLIGYYGLLETSIIRI
ncbi:hypothetical protein FCV25MIE_32123 [Fagus crenata]